VRPSGPAGDRHQERRDLVPGDRLGLPRRPVLGAGREIALDCDSAAGVWVTSRLTPTDALSLVVMVSRRLMTQKCAELAVPILVRPMCAVRSHFSDLSEGPKQASNA
jgi:hypothetical protein